MKGKLEKVSIKEGHRSAVSVGHFTIGDLERIMGYPKNTKAVDVNNLTEIEEGDMLLVYNSFFDFTKCSPIEKIEIIDNKLKVITETSEYLFTEEK